MDFEVFGINDNEQKQDESDDMEVEFDDDDIKNNLEDSKQPIEEEMDESEIEKIESKINTMKQEEGYFDVDSEDEQHQQLVKATEWKRHFGKYIPLVIINDDPVFAISPQWYINIFVIVSLFIATYLQFSKKPQKTMQYCITIILGVLEMLGYIIASLINPGIHSSQYENYNNKNTCKICEITHYRSDTYHCEICNVCIREFHHHSNFFGRCIGQGNLFYYYLSILFLPLYIINFIVLYIF